MMKGRIILLLSTSLTVIPLPTHFPQTCNSENIIAGLHPLPWTSKRNYKINTKIFFGPLFPFPLPVINISVSQLALQQSSLFARLSPAIGLCFKGWSLDLFLFVFPKITWHKNWVCSACWLTWSVEFSYATWLITFHKGPIPPKIALEHWVIFSFKDFIYAF